MGVRELRHNVCQFAARALVFARMPVARQPAQQESCVTIEHPPCPVCQTPTDWEFSCPGYPSPYGWISSCMPACGHAVKHWCKACGWWWREPTNYPAGMHWTEPGPKPTWDVRYPFDDHTEE